MSNFSATVRDLLSNDNAVRGTAEATYNNAKSTNPSETVIGLVTLLVDVSVEVVVREQTAVLLRKCLQECSKEDSFYTKLGLQGKIDLKSKLLQILESEQNPTLRKKIADCVQAFGNAIISIQFDGQPVTTIPEWPELLPTMFRIVCNSSLDAGLRADCLYVMKELTIVIAQVLLSHEHFTTTNQVITSCLNDQNNAIASYTVCFLMCIYDNASDANNSKEIRKNLHPLVKQIIPIMGRVANNPADSKYLMSFLEDLQASLEVTEFVKELVDTGIVPFLSTIAKGHPEEGCKKLALEALVTMSETKPKTMSKAAQFFESLLDVCATFITSVSDDVDSWKETEETDDADDEELFSAGCEGVDRVSRAMNKEKLFEKFMKVLEPAITVLFKSGEWKQVLAAIMLLTQIAEYVDEEESAKQMFNAILVQVQASHPRVRFAAWTAIGQFAQDNPTMVGSDEFVERSLTAFANGMNDPFDRVGSRCMEAFNHFAAVLEREDLDSFVPKMMENVGKKLQGNIDSQKRAITLISVLSAQMEDGFAPYYTELIPLLEGVITNTIHKAEERDLLGRCFECISHLAKAGGRNRFKADMERFMAPMIQATKVADLAANDPIKEYMMSASQRLCSVMKEDFLPFLPHVITDVLGSLTLAPKEYADIQESGNDENISITVVNDGDKVKLMVMSTSEIEELHNALVCINTFVVELKKSYMPYVEQTATAVLPVFDFCMHETIRDVAFEVWGQLIASVRDAGNGELVTKLVHLFLEKTMAKLTDDTSDDDSKKTCADGISTCLKKAGCAVLTSEQVSAICSVSIKMTTELMQEAVAKRTENEEDHARKVDMGDDGEDDTSQLRISLLDIAGALMKHHPDVFVVEGLPCCMSFVQELMKPGVGSEDRKYAHFLACDFLEHLGDRVVSHWPLFLPALVGDLTDADPVCRQAACYGASLAARQPAFAQAAPEAAEKLAMIIKETRARSKKKSERAAQSCADNALSALASILQSHIQAVGAMSQQYWDVWRTGLPCQEDEQEAVTNLKLLARFLDEEKPEILGEGGANVPSIIAILVDQYKVEDFTDDEVNILIGKLVKKLGDGWFKTNASHFNVKQQKKILRITQEN